MPKLRLRLGLRLRAGNARTKRGRTAARRLPRRMRRRNAERKHRLFATAEEEPERGGRTAVWMLPRRRKEERGGKGARRAERPTSNLARPTPKTPKLLNS